MATTPIALTDEISNADANHEEEIKLGDNDPKPKLTDTVQTMLTESFYIYHKSKITGPFNHHEILSQFLAGKIKEKIWVKNMKDANDDDKWCKINLSKEPTSNDNKQFKEEHPKLYEYLVPNIKSIEFKQYPTPIDIPADKVKKASCITKILRLLGKILLVLGCIVFISHNLAALCLACCGVLIYLPFESDKDTVEIAVTVVLCGIAFSGFVVTPFIMVYIVLLDAVDYDEWNGEIQSWMIGYIIWGISTYIFILAMVIGEEVLTGKGKHFLRKFNDVMFFIIGVDFEVDFSRFMDKSDILAAATFLIFPQLAALLPSAIFGFIANFALEEKFELKCNDSIKNDTLCWDDGYGCCEVISSHDIRNTYTFMGGLASNILATWAVIRITGYLMVNFSPQMAVYVKRNK